MRSSSYPDLASDAIALDARNVTEKMTRLRHFWTHGLDTAASSLVKSKSPTPTQSESPSKEAENSFKEGDRGFREAGSLSNTPQSPTLEPDASSS